MVAGLGDNLVIFVFVQVVEVGSHGKGYQK